MQLRNICDSVAKALKIDWTIFCLQDTPLTVNVLSAIIINKRKVASQSFYMVCVWCLLYFLYNWWRLVMSRFYVVVVVVVWWTRWFGDFQSIRKYFLIGFNWIGFGCVRYRYRNQLIIFKRISRNRWRFTIKMS